VAIEKDFLKIALKIDMGSSSSNLNGFRYYQYAMFWILVKMNLKSIFR
jgi:hypothetical protein